MFKNCDSLTDISGLSNWNVSNGIYFNNMFDICYSLTDINGLSNWNVSNGRDFDYIFYDCNKLIKIDGIISWKINFSNVLCIFNNNINLENKEKILSIFGKNNFC